LQRSLQKAICPVVRIAFKIHLGHKSVLPAGNLEVNVRWSHPVGARWICGGFDRLEPISTIIISDQSGRPLKVWIERRGIMIAWMRVTPVGVGLPYFNSRIAHRLAF